MTTGCDFMAEYGYIDEQYRLNASGFSNGYDKLYSSSLLDRTASMILAGHIQEEPPVLQMLTLHRRSKPRWRIMWKV